ncbi:MAG TPA: Trm112 family protein [Desulfuromonadales bacterium]|nr:Trm112 family protein [Desulfuromonadales bacterium]
MISEELLALLACPSCTGELEPGTDRSALLCRHCALSFPVRDGIPVMLIDQAERVS